MKINLYSLTGQFYLAFLCFAAIVVVMIFMPDWFEVAVFVAFGISVAPLYLLKCPNCGMRCSKMNTHKQRFERNLLIPPKCPKCDKALWGRGVDYPE